MTRGLLDGLRVVDISEHDAGRLAGRMFADMGADVVAPPGPRSAFTDLVWSAGKRVVDDVTTMISTADVVLATRAPVDGEANDAVWVQISAFGAEGPRADWPATDLTIVAAGGNLYPTGDPDRPPVRSSQPISVAHTGPEAVIAALTALSSGRPQLVDVSMQETMLVANMGGPARAPLERNRGKRKGDRIGRTREIWPCKDGFVSFGLRGGPARVKNLQAFSELARDAGVTSPALDRDWTAYDPKSLTDAELATLEDAVRQVFERFTMAELYARAVVTAMMLAPANSPREIVSSEQLAARRFFAPLGDIPTVPRTFVRTVVGGEEQDLVTLRVAPVSAAHWPRRSEPWVQRVPRERGWDGLRLLEFGAGAAGPIATRYFANHGATVVRVESRTRPDFLRSYMLSPGDLDSSAFFAVLNPGKLSVSLNMKDERAAELARRLALEWADAVVENFAPGAMSRWGLDYTSLVADRADLVMASGCLNGNSGPHQHYPGFGGQGAALSGYNFVTGWPDRAPLGPAGTITDSLAPRFSAAALAAALLHRDRTGEGCWLDLSQVEAAVYTLAPWIAEFAVTGHIPGRQGNRNENAVPHGVFPAEGDDKWVAVSVTDDTQWCRLAELISCRDSDLTTIEGRHARVDEVEKRLAAWTTERPAGETAVALQQRGIAAYEVHDWADISGDPQLVARGHFVSLHHPVIGQHLYEQDGFRLVGTPSGSERPAPMLGEHTELVLREFLGVPPDEIAELQIAGVLS